MQEVNLIRHGKTNDNNENRYSGRIESQLVWNAEEIKQIVLPKISTQDMGTIYSSPRYRAIDTARPFVDNPSDIILKEDMREINFGDFDGLTYEEISRIHPEEVDKWLFEQDEYVFPNGDSLRSFYQRTVNGFQEILSQASHEKNITIFTHGGVIQCLISYLLSNSLDLFWNFKIDNCSLTQFYFSHDKAVFKKINN